MNEELATSNQINAESGLGYRQKLYIPILFTSIEATNDICAFLIFLSLSLSTYTHHKVKQIAAAAASVATVRRTQNG